MVRKMIYIESKMTDPAFNLALEQYAFDILSKQNDLFMLWQNRNAVIVGLHQNTAQEISKGFVDAHNVSVIRRLSGGGAVYHDMGNINFTFITRQHDNEDVNFEDSCKPIADALTAMGFPVEFRGRNDMTIDGKKFSGNARYFKDGRLMHHGTLLFDVNLETLARVLHVADDKLISKGVKSVRSRVTNLSEYTDMSVSGFWQRLRDTLAAKMPHYELTPDDINAIEEIKINRYDTWEWNYGRSPAFSVVKQRRIDGFGNIRISMEANNGVISAFATDGDYFGVKPYYELAEVLIGVRLERSALSEAIKDVRLSDFYEGLEPDSFVSIILD